MSTAALMQRITIWYVYFLAEAGFPDEARIDVLIVSLWR